MYLIEGTNNTNETINDTIVLLNGNYADKGVCDIICKYKEETGKWAFKWVKKYRGQITTFLSDYVYDDIISVKNNRIVFIKDGRRGFWYFNTRTEFFYP